MDDIQNLHTANILNRKSYLSVLSSLLTTTNKPLSIALDGQWGSGKTVFLKELLYVSQTNMDNIDHDNIDHDNIDNLKDFREKYFITYFDAWEYDKYNDPLITILYVLTNTAIENSEPTDNDIKMLNSFLESIGKAACQFVLEKNKFLKLTINNMQEEKQQFSNIISLDQQIATIQEYISHILEITHKEKMIIIIDELDRCTPNYAVNLLEITKHIFNNEHCHLLFGINKLELSKCINQHYGNINSIEYLDKMFDITLSLPNPNNMQLKQYIEFQNNQAVKEHQEIPISKGYTSVIIPFYQQLNLSLREINRTLTVFQNIYPAYFSNQLNCPPEDIQLFIELFICLYIVKIKKYSVFNQIKNNEEQSIDSLISNLKDINIQSDTLDTLFEKIKTDQQNIYEDDYKQIISLVNFFK